MLFLLLLYNHVILSLSSLTCVTELVDVPDLKSCPPGCQFESGHGYMNIIFFLRKVKIFNKSRYSRNRQNTRVAFYFSLIINILVIFAVFSLYYKILFKLSILWWFFYVFLFSFIFSSFLRTLATTSITGLIMFFKQLLKRS